MQQHQKRSLHALRVSRDDGDIGLSTSTCTLSSSSVIEDIDESDAECRECITEYAADVMHDLTQKEREQHQQLRPLNDVCVANRTALLMWMEKVRQRFALLLDTTLLAISILDRCASKHAEPAAPAVAQENSSDNHFAMNVLHAGAAVILAAALEEVYPPEAKDVLEACTNRAFLPTADIDSVGSENAFARAHMLTRDDICATTSRMARALGYDLWTVHFLHFLRRFSRASQHTVSEHNFAKQFCIAALHDYDNVVLQLRPSALAAAAVYYTRCHFSARFRKPWSKTLEHFSGYSAEQARAFMSIADRSPPAAQ